MSFVPSLPFPTRAILFLPHVSGKGTRLNDSPAFRVTGSPESASSSEMSQAMFQSLLLKRRFGQELRPPRRKTAGLAFSSRTRSSRSSIRIRSTGTLGNVQLAGAVMYGTSHNDSKGVSIIDAASGKFLRVAK